MTNIYGNLVTNIWRQIKRRLPSWKSPRRCWTCSTLRTPERVSDRQERITGWDQKRYANAVGLFVGGGGINGEIAEGAVMKGLGTVHLVDFDIVSPSNLNRQKFTRRNLYRNKAVELCRNLSRRGSLGTKLIAHSCAFQDLSLDQLQPDFVVCGVDNQFPETRLEVSRWCRSRNIPAVILGVSTDASHGYVFVQTKGQADWACVFRPEIKRDQGSATRCPGTPACVDILKALSGPALYAIDSLLMSRPRHWNYWSISLSGEFGGARMVRPRSDCPTCMGKGA